jgi:hypothetical protein
VTTTTTRVLQQWRVDFTISNKRNRNHTEPWLELRQWAFRLS